MDGEQSGVVGEKILGRKIDVKNSKRKINWKNWSSWPDQIENWKIGGEN